MTSLIKFEDLELPALTEIAKEQYKECLWAIEDALKKQLEFGRVLLIVKSKLPHGEWGNWVRETFTDHKSLRTIQRHMRGAEAIATDPSLLEYADSLDAVLKIVEEPKPSVQVIENKPDDVAVDDVETATVPTPQTEAKPHVANNSGNHEWYTPAEYIDAARDVMGGIDLDPASSKIANKTVKAKKFYTAAQDGLTKTWQGTVWLNPPYAQPLIRQFTEKLAENVWSGDVTAAIALVNNATDTTWWQELASTSTVICFPKTRVKFLNPDGNPGAPLQGQSVLYFGDQPEAFFEAFSVLGLCVVSQHLFTTSSE
jgi:phage N-6-adenine-methyltransferase